MKSFLLVSFAISASVFAACAKPLKVFMFAGRWNSEAGTDSLIGEAIGEVLKHDTGSK